MKRDVDDVSRLGNSAIDPSDWYEAGYDEGIQGVLVARYSSSPEWQHEENEMAYFMGFEDGKGDFESRSLQA